MATLSDSIEEYILECFKENKETKVSLRRQDLSALFSCVPSQINYVLNTRFTLERGYIVESRRGGGGYLYIFKVFAENSEEYLKWLDSLCTGQINSLSGGRILARLVEEGLLKEEEKELLWQLLKDESLPVPIESRNLIRGKMLKNLFCFLASRGGIENEV